MFTERKVAQMAAYFLNRRGGQMSHLKLMKLLFLADREAINRHNAPISFDCISAMPHGPALSQTLNYMDGDVESSPGGWNDWISDKENYELSLKVPITRQTLDELSEAEIEILDHIWLRFGHMTRWQIRDYTHRHCPEWEDPHGSSKPIPFERVFRVLGRSEDEARELAEEVEAERSIDRLFASL